MAATEGYRILIEAELNCGHLFSGEIAPRIGDILWCAQCGDYVGYGPPDIRKPRHGNDRIVDEWRQDNPNWFLDVYKRGLR